METHWRSNLLALLQKGNFHILVACHVNITDVTLPNGVPRLPNHQLQISHLHYLSQPVKQYPHPYEEILFLLHLIKILILNKWIHILLAYNHRFHIFNKIL